MVEVNRELIISEIDNFLEALEINKEDFQEEKTITVGKETQKLSRYNELVKSCLMPMAKGRLVLNAEEMTATYTFRRALKKGDFNIATIVLDPENAQYGKISMAEKAMKNGKVLAGVLLFSSDEKGIDIPEDVLSLASPSEIDLLVWLSNLFFML